MSISSQCLQYREYSYCTEVIIKLLKARRLNLNGFSFTDYFRILMLSSPFVMSKYWVLNMFYYKIIITASDLLTITKYVTHQCTLLYFRAMLKSIWELCCVYHSRTDLTPFYDSYKLMP